MQRPIFSPLSPERIFWTGVVVLGIGLAMNVGLLFYCSKSPHLIPFFPFSKKKELDCALKKKSFDLRLKKMPVSFLLPQVVASEMTFSFDPSRPDKQGEAATLFVRLKKSGQSNRISLPCRIDLQFSNGILNFAEPSSRFWLEIVQVSDEKIEATTWVQTASNENWEAEKLIFSPQCSPLQGPEKFPIDSPFHVLAQARWLGHDLVAEKYDGVRSLQIVVKDEVFNVREKDWMIWTGGRWVKGALNDQSPSIARIEGVDSQSLILEGWYEDKHVRLSLPLTASAPFKMRGEDIFTSVRIRSEKQISCMMEKQCLILRSGDWVIKAGGRWKILRKKEEREAYKLGKLSGEVFVFEKIESKQGQKFVLGFLFNSERSQLIPIHLPGAKHSVRKGAKEK